MNVRGDEIKAKLFQKTGMAFLPFAINIIGGNACSLKPITSSSSNIRSYGIATATRGSVFTDSSASNFLMVHLWPRRRCNLQELRINDEKSEIVQTPLEFGGGEKKALSIENWIFKILRVRSRWKDRKRSDEDENSGNLVYDCGKKHEEGDDCGMDRVSVDNLGVKGVGFDRKSFSELLRRVSLSDAKVYAQMSYLGNLAYYIPRIKGSESLASWQANLLFEPVLFEGLEFPVHRGIYEAAKGIYSKLLPYVKDHMARKGGGVGSLRFTGHSLGGSLALLVSLMLLLRGAVPPASLLPVITFGAPSIMCGGDRLLEELGLPRAHLRAVAMHRDIVPRAFSCSYPPHVADFLKAINRSFRDHHCLHHQKVLYCGMGELLILQPEEKVSPPHELLPEGSGLYEMRGGEEGREGRSIFMNTPHPLEILSDRSSYGPSGTIQRDHDVKTYLRALRGVVFQEFRRLPHPTRDDIS